MKFLYISFVIILSSCCFGNRKCPQGNLGSSFRILNTINGEDLLFGPNSIYNKDSIKFFSIKGTDTMFNTYYAGTHPSQPDSFFTVGFYNKEQTVYVKLNASDIDTMKLVYETYTSQCCDDVSTIKMMSYNNDIIQKDSTGISIINK